MNRGANISLPIQVKKGIRHYGNDEVNYIEIAKCLQNSVFNTFEKSAFDTKCRHFQLIPLNQEITNYFSPYSYLMNLKLYQAVFSSS